METNLVAVQIELTNACNLNCAECPRSSMTRPVGHMDIELAKIIAKDAIAYNPNIGLNLNGLGEPLFYPHLTGYVKYLGSIGIEHFELFLNCAYMPGDLDELLKAINESGSTVLIAMTKHMYDKSGMRQVFSDDAFTRIVDSLGHNQKVNIHMNMVLNKYHTEEDIGQFFSEYRRYLPHDNVHVTEKLNPWFGLVSEYAWKNGYDEGCLSPSVCDYPFILSHVGWNGDVLICCTDDVRGDCKLGKIIEPGDLVRIWEGKEMNNIRGLFNSFFFSKREKVIAPCNECNRTEWLRYGIR